MLDRGWAAQLARLYTPGRYIAHALQMGAAYLCQIAPASTISNCCTYQAADTLRWLTHTAYRTKELSNTFGDLGFGTGERDKWENDPAWQDFRELVEKALVAYDALNLVARPAYEEAVLRALGKAGRHNGDTLLGMVTDAQLVDADRHRRWSGALVKQALETEGNREVFATWIAKWAPLGDAAIDAYCAHLPDSPDAAANARAACAALRRGYGL
jgi:toluene monooxygenase system protein E